MPKALPLPFKQQEHTGGMILYISQSYYPLNIWAPLVPPFSVPPLTDAPWIPSLSWMSHWALSFQALLCQKLCWLISLRLYLVLWCSHYLMRPTSILYPPTWTTSLQDSKPDEGFYFNLHALQAIQSSYFMCYLHGPSDLCPQEMSDQYGLSERIHEFSFCLDFGA